MEKKLERTKELEESRGLEVQHLVEESGGMIEEQRFGGGGGGKGKYHRARRK